MRHVAYTLPSLVLVAVVATTGFSVAKTGDSDEASLRVAGYQTPSGDAYFAVSVQPGADDALLSAVRQAEADIVVVVDTSASQVGEYRQESLVALQSVMESLRPGDRIRIFAGDVRASDLSESFGTADAASTQQAISKLQQRLPLGNTNLNSVIGSVRAALVAEPEDHTRSIVYIGDGSSIEMLGREDRFAGLVDALRADRISVHSVAIGPTTNIELLAILANQTGGVLGMVGTDESNSAASIASRVGDAATMSPVWLSEAKLPEGMVSVQADRLPPLRLDRDSILLGTMKPEMSEVKIQLTGETTASTVRIVAEADVEKSHPDFSFVPGLVANAKANHGLMLPTAGSRLFRATGESLATRADELVRAGNMALKQGNRRGAKAVAEKALETDPENADAKAIQKITHQAKRLIIQNAGDSPFDDIFGGAAPAADDDNPFGADAAPAADAAAPAAAAAVDPAPAVATPAAQPAPAASAPAADRFAAPAGDDALLETGGDLLDRVQAQRTAADGRLRAEVRAQLRAATAQLKIDPQGVAGSLKSLLAQVETTPDIDPQLRQELVSQVRSAIQISGRKLAEYFEAVRNLEQIQASATSSARLLQETFRREDTLKTLSQQMNALIDEGRYTDADGEVSIPFSRLAGDTITRDSVAGRHFRDNPLALQTYARDRRYREMRERNFVDAFSLVLKSNIPFVDEPPIVYPDADIWQRMSRRRIERYGAIELVGDNQTERRIQAALGDETTQTFVESPLEEAIQAISDAHDIPIVVDRRALEEIGLTPDTPVSLSLKNVTLRSFMRLMLRELDLTYMIKDEVMQITTVEAAEQNLVNKVYPVGDLVVPILQLGGGGGGGGGMGGGGGGMGGGGMGGGGGGMGGGGMGGGGGGGMFAVPDEISLQGKTSTGGGQAPVAETAPKTSKKAYYALPIRLELKPGQSKAQAWEEFFAETKIHTAEELTILDQRIRATVSQSSTKAAAAHEAKNTSKAVEHFGDARDTIAAAIRAGHVQPWMYHAYAIALKATDAPSEQVERALLSAVDFAETPEDVLHVAARLQNIGSEAAALRLCQDVAAIDPYRREPFVMGLEIAQRLDDMQGLTWACQGILSQAWPEKFQPVVDEARLVARATYAQLLEEGRKEEAEAFSAALKQATAHDAIVRVSWTGDADIDVAVEEPSGTVCSLDNRSTAGGGTLLGDSFPGHGDDETGTVSETYMCPKGFAGQYRLLVRRVWGNVSTGHATVEVLTDAGRPSQRYVRKEIPLTEKDALVVFEVKDGQRKQEVAEAQLAHLRDVQRDAHNEVLGQVIGKDSGEVLSELFRDVQRLTGGVGGIQGRAGFGRRGAVGFRPEITTLPEGATVLALAIISADRRYVRITPAPFFSQVGDVTTFNFVTGDEGMGGGGGGGLGGGLGGGGFGGGGGGGGIGN